MPDYSHHADQTAPAPTCGCAAVPTRPVTTRRSLLAGGVAVSAAVLLASPSAASAATPDDRAVPARQPAVPVYDTTGTSVVLLGTAAGPVPQFRRNMNSQALVVDGATYLIDCGNGVVRQLVNAGIRYETIRDIFITHLHPDHMSDYLPAFLFGRSIGPQPGFTHIVNTYGPGRAGSLPTGVPGAGETVINPALPTPGLVDTHQSLLDADAYFANLIYIANDSSTKLPHVPGDIRDLVIPHDITLPAIGASATGTLAPAMTPFPIFEDNRVKVTAILVDHPPVFPAYAYRFDTDHGSVVFSGDTRPSENLVTLARRADLLVHEAGNAAAMLDHGTPPELIKSLLASHTDVHALGVIAAKADVQALALTHIISTMPLSAYPPPINEPAWITPIHAHYKGPVHLGQDLMKLSLHNGTVRVAQL